MTSDSSRDSVQTRRRFLQLGAATVSASVLSGCKQDEVIQDPQAKQSVAATQEQAGSNAPPQGIDLEKWKKLKGEAYPAGTENTPGVCPLPGPNAKRQWPDPNKYKGTKKVPGMCQLCSTICGIVGHVKDGRLIKLEGNPNDPNSRGRLCARGHA